MERSGGLAAKGFYVEDESGNIVGGKFAFERGHALVAAGVFHALEDLLGDGGIGEFALGEILGAEFLAGRRAGLAIGTVARGTVRREHLSTVGAVKGR